MDLLVMKQKSPLKNFQKLYGLTEDGKYNSLTKALWNINVQLAYFKQEMTTKMQDMTH